MSNPDVIDDAERIRPRLLPALARYVVAERRPDGRPLDPVARFHLGNGAAAWQLDWPANSSPEAWRQSYGAMINYRYEPDQLERRHEDFVRRGAVAVGGPLEEDFPQHEAPYDRASEEKKKGTTPMSTQTSPSAATAPSVPSTGPSSSRRNSVRTRRSSSCPTGGP